MNNNSERIDGISKTLLPHQLRSIELIEKFNGKALITDETGMGKTLQALAYAEKHKDTIRQVLIMCPAKLVDNWVNEIKANINNGCLKINIVKHVNPVTKTILSRFDYVKYNILSYEKATSVMNEWYKFNKLKELPIDLLIMDEIHNVKNANSQRGQTIHSIAIKVGNVIALSATPMVNNINELAYFVNILKPEIIISGRGLLCNYTNTKTNVKFFTPYKMQLAAELEKHVLIRNDKTQEVIDKFPAVNRQFIKTEIDNRDEYNKAYFNFLGYAQDNDICCVNKLCQVNYGNVKSHCLCKLTGLGKLHKLYEILSSRLIETSDKIIVYFEHTEVLNKAYDMFHKYGLKIDGSVMIHKRKEIIQEFNDNNDKRVLFCNTRAGGEGLNGLTIASCVIFHELAWTAIKHEQAEGRINRIGQIKDVIDVIYIIADQTKDVDILNTIYDKQMGSRAVFNYRINPYMCDYNPITAMNLTSEPTGRENYVMQIPDTYPWKRKEVYTPLTKIETASALKTYLWCAFVFGAILTIIFI